MPKPRDAGVYETPMPDKFTIVGDDWEPLAGDSNIPFAGYDKNFAQGSDPHNPQDMPADCPTPDGRTLLELVDEPIWARADGTFADYCTAVDAAMEADDGC